MLISPLGRGLLVQRDSHVVIAYEKEIAVRQFDRPKNK